MAWFSQHKSKDAYPKAPTAEVNMTAQLMSLAGVGFEKQLNNATFANKFYKTWCEIARKDMQAYAREHAAELVQTDKFDDRTLARKVPLKSKYRVYGKYAELYVWSYPTNYVFKVGKKNVPSNWLKFKKDQARKPVRGSNGKWFTPKKYKKDVPKDVISSDYSVELQGTGAKRFFTSKTSHNKTRKYGMPFVWYQTGKGKVKPLQLRQQIADTIMQKTDIINTILEEAFAKAIDKVK